jgi:hypothetical protein
MLTLADLPQFSCSMIRVIRQETNFHILIHDYRSVYFGYVKGLIGILSEDAFTATNLSKFSSTKILTASLRLSIALSRCEIPFRRSL